MGSPIIVLAHTVASAVYTARNIADGHKYGRLYGDKTWRWHLDAGDPEINDRFLPGRAEKIADGDLALAPPAYPGERGSIQFGPPH